MDDGPHRDHLLDRIDAHVLQAQLPNEGELLVDQLLPQVTEVEMDVVSVRPFERAALLLLLDEGLGESVAPAQLHRAPHPSRLWPAQVVILEVTIAVLVQEP